MDQGIRKNLLPGQSRQAIDWYRAQARRMGGSVTATRLLKNNPSNLSQQLLPGNMMLFNYDPKHKKTLPYYDIFPLVFPIDTFRGGFIGMNMHYLPYRLRAQLMDALYDNLNNTRFDESTKLNISYKTLASAAKYKYFKPTIHKYLYKHVRSKFLVIDAKEWDQVLMLPVQKFVGASIQTVWSDSRKKV